MTFKEEDFLKIRRELHQIPEIGMEEYKTSQYLLEKIQEITKDATNIEQRMWKTGIIVKVAGTNSQKIIGWRTDIDGLPLDEQVESSYKSTHQGRMHACGHDFHMTMALGLLQKAVENPAIHDRLFFFQPAEENFAGGMLMYEAGCFDGWMPDEFYALHVHPDLPTGQISTNNHTLFAATCEVHVTFTGKSGHAAIPQNANDMVVAASAFVMQAQTIVARNVNPLDNAVITFGTLNAGTANNIIAGDAKLSGTIRTFTNEVSQLTEKRLRQIAEGIALTYDCQAQISFKQGGYLPVINDKDLADEFMSFMESNANFQEIGSLMTGEDFGYLLDKTKGVMFWLGVNSPYPLHHQKFNPDEKAIFPAIVATHKWLEYRANTKNFNHFKGSFRRKKFCVIKKKKKYLQPVKKLS